MGCDGGTIPTRDEMVRLKKKPEQKDKDGDRVAKWKHCQISQQPLEPPIVVCELGWLYNKTSVIEFLLDRSKFKAGDKFDHIRGLKDVKELKLTENPAAMKSPVDVGSEYICPVTGLEMSGKWRFCYLYGCGCAFSERAMKEVKSDTCHTIYNSLLNQCELRDACHIHMTSFDKCGSPTQSSDLVIINGTEDEVSVLRTRMEERRAQAKLEKKAKRKRKLEASQGTASSDGSSADGPSTCKESKFDPSHIPSTSKSGSAASSAGTKLANGSKAGRSVTANGKEREMDQKPKSIRDDPKASSAYKSLFTSCDKARNQPKPHWVTHNPCFY